MATEPSDERWTADAIVETIRDNPEYWLKPPSPLTRILDQYSEKAAAEGRIQARREMEERLHAIFDEANLCRVKQGRMILPDRIKWACEQLAELRRAPLVVEREKLRAGAFREALDAAPNRSETHPRTEEWNDGYRTAVLDYRRRLRYRKGEPHYHVAGDVDPDKCQDCGRNFRDSVHRRTAEEGS